MNIEKNHPTSVDWDSVPLEKIKGETGYSIIKTQTLGQIKIRQVEYSDNYIADHWCDKGHIAYVIQGELQIEHKNSTPHILTRGMSYLIGDETLSHKVKSETGATILIID